MGRTHAARTFEPVLLQTPVVNGGPGLGLRREFVTEVSDVSMGSKRGQPGGSERGDFELMQRVAASDESAVAELYDRFGSLVFRMAYQAMPTRMEAEDAVQEVFVRLWKTAGRYDQTRAALVTWVMLICRRHLVDKLRRSKARLRASSIEQPAGQMVADPATSSGRLEVDEKVKVLMGRIEMLPELQRTVVMRAYLGGQTLRQIGEELNTPLGTIKSALSRALVRLRERSGEELAI
ncbi:MAG: sigma-70 family RNA polymerase sigma factor [Phycisphaerae bacterium]|nr:sigma-70 family RNA polymerase sigma factor [Phycisphaerae bacterium]